MGDKKYLIFIIDPNIIHCNCCRRLCVFSLAIWYILTVGPVAKFLMGIIELCFTGRKKKAIHRFLWLQNMLGRCTLSTFQSIF